MKRLDDWTRVIFERFEPSCEENLDALECAEKKAVVRQ